MKEIIRQKIEAAVRELSFGEISTFDVSRTKDAQFGDYATNVAMVLAKSLGKSPMEIAKEIESRITNHESREEKEDALTGHCEHGEAISDNVEIAAAAGQPRNDRTVFEKIEVARPGYINFFLSPAYLEGVLGEVLEKGAHFGDAEIGSGKKVSNELISANPTGPLHLGNARGGFSGDAISRVLRKAGYDVTNEYYVNDAGEQIMKLGHSVLKDSEAVYSGDYIDTLNSQFAIRHSPFDPREAGEWAAEIVLDDYIKKTVEGKMGIPIDLWVSEKRDIVEAGLVDEAIGVFGEKNLTFESEGALWLKTTEFGDDKDRVLVKSDGTRTYFASDCGYILQKKRRGFSRLILILGADHHGYKVRLQSAAKALGFDGAYDVSFVQLVRLMKDGVEVRMSKRAGNVVTIDELLEAVGGDVARFFFLMYSPDTHMNFDLGLAEERSAKNPVYYVQYAHARLSNILRKAEENGLSVSHCKRSDAIKDADEIAASKTPRNDGASGNPNFSLLVHPKERELLREIAFFPELVEEIAESYAVHRLPQYAMRLADKLHSFYDECRVIDTENVELSKARLALVLGVKTVLKETLSLLGIDAPERMESASGSNEPARTASQSDSGRQGTGSKKTENE